MQHKALRQYLEARLHREYAQEVGLGRLLWQKREDSADFENGWGIGGRRRRMDNNFIFESTMSLEFLLQI